MEIIGHNFIKLDLDEESQLNELFYQYREKFLKEKEKNTTEDPKKSFLNPEEKEKLEKYYKHDPDFVVNNMDELEELTRLRKYLSKEMKWAKHKCYKRNLKRWEIDKIFEIYNTVERFFNKGSHYSFRNDLYEKSFEDKWKFDESLEVVVELEDHNENQKEIPKPKKISSYIAYSVLEDNKGDEIYFIEEAVDGFKPRISKEWVKNIRKWCIKNQNYAVIPKKFIEKDSSLNNDLEDLGFHEAPEITIYNKGTQVDSIDQELYVFDPLEIDEEDLLLEED
jgi:hypothetical protein